VNNKSGNSPKIGGLYAVYTGVLKLEQIYLYLGFHKMYIVKHSIPSKIGTIEEHPDNERWLLQTGVLLNDT